MRRTFRISVIILALSAVLLLGGGAIRAMHNSQQEVVTPPEDITQAAVQERAISQTSVTDETESCNSRFVQETACTAPEMWETCTDEEFDMP